MQLTNEQYESLMECVDSIICDISNLNFGSAKTTAFVLQRRLVRFKRLEENYGTPSSDQDN